MGMKETQANIKLPGCWAFVNTSDSLVITGKGESIYEPDTYAILYLLNSGRKLEDVNLEINTNQYYGKYDLPWLKLRLSLMSSRFKSVALDGHQITPKQLDDFLKDDELVTYDSKSIFTSPDQRGGGGKGESLYQDMLFGKVGRFIPDEGIVSKHMIREFPTGIFRKLIKEDERRFSTLRMDYLALTKDGRICPIEMKIFNNAPLDLAAQGINYALYCLKYGQYLAGEYFGTKEGISGVKLIFLAHKYHKFFLLVLDKYLESLEERNVQVRAYQNNSKVRIEDALSYKIVVQK